MADVVCSLDGRWHVLGYCVEPLVVVAGAIVLLLIFARVMARRP